MLGRGERRVGTYESLQSAMQEIEDTEENGVMSLQSKREYLGQIRSRYHRAGRVHKSKILDEYCLVCGYDRKYAIKRLANDPPRPRRKPGRQPRYDKELLLPVLQRVWLASDQMCSKRLRAALPKWLPHLAPLSVPCRTQLLALSPATLDRRLQPLRGRYPGKGLAGTKPGTLLKHHLPVRTGHWDITRPGFHRSRHGGALRQLAGRGFCLAPRLDGHFQRLDPVAGRLEQRRGGHPGTNRRLGTADPLRPRRL